MVICGPSGSGKTVGFGLAIAPTILGDADKFDGAAAPLALVIAPTRELALQVLYALDIDGGIGLMDAEVFNENALMQLKYLSKDITDDGQDLSFLLISGVHNNLSEIDNYIENQPLSIRLSHRNG